MSFTSTFASKLMDEIPETCNKTSDNKLVKVIKLKRQSRIELAVDNNRNRQPPVLSGFYLDDLNSKGVIVWVAAVIECESHRLCPINALFSNIVISQTEPDLECIHSDHHQIYG